MKILINTPNINSLGGVANHYLGLKPYWTHDVRYCSLGSKRWRKIMSPFTIIKFIWKLIFFNPEVVLVNPSLGKGALTRDFIYMKLAKILGKKVVVFIHGFDLKYAEIADWKWITLNLNQVDGIIVLAQMFKDILIQHGVTSNIYLSTTKVSDTLIEGFNVKNRTGEVKNILFLSRIERTKGVYEAVDTFALLKSKYKNLTLTFVGDGSELNNLKKYVQEKQLNDVRFTGGLSGSALKNEYLRANFFFFTSYGEGMPTVVLEAMAFGLPVMTRSVGGLCDFFEDKKMGRITDSMNPNKYADMMIPFLENTQLTKHVSEYNYQYAKTHFMASIVTKNMESILLNV